jgi:hypothetical protein
MREDSNERAVARLDELIETADHVLATYKPNPPGTIGFPTLSAKSFTEWQTQSLSFLVPLLGENHIYVEMFRAEVEAGHRGSVQAGQGILIAVREDIAGGYLSRLKRL